MIQHDLKKWELEQLAGVGHRGDLNSSERRLVGAI